jgi:hypothetical protein
MHDVSVCGHNLAWHESLFPNEREEHEAVVQKWLAVGGKTGVKPLKLLA